MASLERFNKILSKNKYIYLVQNITLYELNNKNFLAVRSVDPNPIHHSMQVTPSIPSLEHVANKEGSLL